MGRTLYHKFMSHLERYQGCIFRDNKYMDNIIFPGNSFQQILMTQGEWIGINHCSSNFFSIHLFLHQLIRIILETVPSIFHKYKLVLHTGYFMEVQFLKHFRRFAFSIEEEINIASFMLIFNKMCYQLVEETLPLMSRIHCHASQGVFETRTCSQKVILFIK